MKKNQEILVQILSTNEFENLAFNFSVNVVDIIPNLDIPFVFSLYPVINQVFFPEIVNSFFASIKYDQTKFQARTIDDILLFDEKISADIRRIFYDNNAFFLNINNILSDELRNSKNELEKSLNLFYISIFPTFIIVYGIFIISVEIDFNKRKKDFEILISRGSSYSQLQSLLLFQIFIYISSILFPFSILNYLIFKFYKLYLQFLLFTNSFLIFILLTMMVFYWFFINKRIKSLFDVFYEESGKNLVIKKNYKGKFLFHLFTSIFLLIFSFLFSPYAKILTFFGHEIFAWLILSVTIIYFIYLLFLKIIPTIVHVSQSIIKKFEGKLGEVYSRIFIANSNNMKYFSYIFLFYIFLSSTVLFTSETMINSQRYIQLASVAGDLTIKIDVDAYWNYSFVTDFFNQIKGIEIFSPVFINFEETYRWSSIENRLVSVYVIQPISLLDCFHELPLFSDNDVISKFQDLNSTANGLFISKDLYDDIKEVDKDYFNTNIDLRTSSFTAKSYNLTKVIGVYRAFPIFNLTAQDQAIIINFDIFGEKSKEFPVSMIYIKKDRNIKINEVIDNIHNKAIEMNISLDNIKFEINEDDTSQNLSKFHNSFLKVIYVINTLLMFSLIYLSFLSTISSKKSSYFRFISRGFHPSKLIKLTSISYSIIICLLVIVSTLLSLPTILLILSNISIAKNIGYINVFPLKTVLYLLWNLIFMVFLTWLFSKLQFRKKYLIKFII